MTIGRVSQSDATHQDHPKVRRHTDGSGHLRTMPFGPGFHHQRDAQGPFAAHA